jgi:hypothetical protein
MSNCNNILNIDWSTYLDTTKKFKEPNTENFPIPDNVGIFIKFFKWMLMQYPIRKYFIQKFNHDSPTYYMIKIDFDDVCYKEKVEFIKNEKLNSRNVIIDIVEQLENKTGHWTTLYIKNGPKEEVEYMDSDPFSYGSSAEKKHKSLHQLLKKISKPTIIYPKTKYVNSIQNIHKLDTFCQSWSLLFSTMKNSSILYSNSIHFQSRIINNQDNDETNFNELIQNFILLIQFWINLFEQTTNEFDQFIRGSQWELWTSNKILSYLKQLEPWIKSHLSNIIHHKDDLLCVTMGNLEQFQQSTSRSIRESSKRTKRTIRSRIQESNIPDQSPIQESSKRTKRPISSSSPESQRKTKRTKRG